STRSATASAVDRTPARGEAAPNGPPSVTGQSAKDATPRSTPEPAWAAAGSTCARAVDARSLAACETAPKARAAACARRAGAGGRRGGWRGAGQPGLRTPPDRACPRGLREGHAPADRDAREPHEHPVAADGQLTCSRPRGGTRRTAAFLRVSVAAAR